MPDARVGWNQVRFGDAGTWLSGGTPATTVPEYWGGDIPWVSSSSLTTFQISQTRRTLTSLGASNGSRLVDEGTVLFVVRGMSLKSEFRLGIAQRQVAFGQDCKAVVPHRNFDANFLAYAIKAQTRQILDMVDEAGHGTGRLVTSRIADLRLPLPPKVEQLAITSVLSAVEDKRANSDRLGKATLQLAATLMQQAAAEVSVPLGRAAVIQKGLSYKGEHLADTGMPMVNLANAARFGGFKRTGWKHYTGPTSHATLPTAVTCSWRTPT